MPDDPPSRRLTTIVALDVAGYSARTEADEARTTAEVAALRRVIEGIAAAHGGRVFNTAGDGFMLEFGSSLAAVEAAFALADTCEPKVRVGVHLGDVVVQPGGDLLGHGVNVAARLMARSDPGSVLVSADVRRTIRGPMAERLVSRGSLQLDKMTETIEAFALGSAASAVAATPRASAEPLLAVLPFDNLSDDREMQFFSDGVSEEIIQRLSRGAQMKVIGRTSSFQFRGADKTARNVAKELRCSHILDGSIRRAGGRVRIAAHLVEAASQTTLWSDRYDRSLEDIFAVQDEISEHIAAALDRTFTSFSTRAIDPAVYDLYLRASPRSYAPDELRTNVGLLEVVTQRAPHFAEAWGRLAYLRALAALLSALCRSRRERRPRGARGGARSGARSAERRCHDGAALRDPAVRTVRRGRRDPGADTQARMARATDTSTSAGTSARWAGFAKASRRRSAPIDWTRSNPMSANALALARMAAGRVAEAVPLFEDLVARVPDMSFPVASLLRALRLPRRIGRRSTDCWSSPRSASCASSRTVCRSSGPSATPRRRTSSGIRRALEAQVGRTGCVDVSRLVYAAHLGLVEEAYRAADSARLGPVGTSDDIMGPDGYRTGAVVPGGHARAAQRSALRAPVRAPGPRRVLVGDGQMARLRG